MAIQIETTQNVVIEQEQAGLGLRTFAYIIDIAICTLWFIIMIVLVINIADTITSEFIRIVYVIITVIPIVFYDLLFETFNNGQSPGKKIMKIRVVNLDGTKPSFGSLLIRWLFRPIDFSISYYLLGIIMILSTKNGQRLGDYLAGTTVVNLKASTQDESLSLSDLNFNEDYQVTFPDVLERINDRDIRTIRTVIDKLEHNEFTINQIADKVRFNTGYSVPDGNNLMFLRTIVNDYTYLSLH